MGMGVAVRTQGPRMFDSIRHTVQRVNNQQVVHDAQTMGEIISGSIASQRFSMILLGAFAGLALLLSSIGIYGVISYIMGAKPGRSAYAWLSAHKAETAHDSPQRGVVSFARSRHWPGASLGLTRICLGMLFGVSPADPITFISVAVLLVSITACYFPARRATRVDPVIALRYE